MFKRNKTAPAVPVSPAEMLLDRAAAGFMNKLPEKDFPNESQWREAQNAAETIFQEGLCSEKFLAGEAAANGDLQTRPGFFKLELAAWMNEHPLPLPAPTFNERMNGFKLALATVIGTFLGSLLFSGLFNFLTDDPRTGFTLGALIGAGGTVLLMSHASENKKVRRYLQGLLGVAAAAEVAIFFGTLSGVGAIWSALRAAIPGAGFLRMLKRFFLYVTVFFILRMSVRQPEFDRQAYQKNLRIVLGLWLDHARAFLQTLGEKSKSLPPPTSTKILIPKELGKCLFKIHQSSPEMLPEAAAETLLVARNIGLEGLEGEPVFISGVAAAPAQITWEKSLEETYRAHGVIAEGDAVFIETRPVIQDGKVIEKGTVRKVRKR
jgi:hypothetical protein